MEGAQTSQSGIEIKGVKIAWSLLSCIRYREVLILQGAPLMGIIFSVGKLTARNLPAIALFGVAGFLLVAHIWSLNDWSDIYADQGDVNKSADVFSSKGIDRCVMLWFSILLLATSLGLFVLLGSQTFLIAVCIAFLGFLYSFSGINAKGIPLLSSVPHLIGGLLHFLLGYSLFASIDRNAVLIAIFFSVTFTSGHAVQEVQDCDADRGKGIRTNAVVFGKKPVYLAALAGFSFAYCYLISLALAGIVPARLGLECLILFPLHLYWALKTFHKGLAFERVSQFRNQYRALFALIGLNMISMLFL